MIILAEFVSLYVESDSCFLKRTQENGVHMNSTK